MDVINEGLPLIVDHDGQRYYQDGALLVPVDACSCNALADPLCAVPSHRVKAKARKRLQCQTIGWWVENRLKAGQAGPILVVGASGSQGGP